MATLFNMNRVTLINDNPIISWKGRTFNQITTSIKKNMNTTTSVNAGLGTIFLPNPLKIFRREIASPFDTNSCNARTSTKIDELDRPNGSIVYPQQVPYQVNGIKNTCYFNLTENSSQRPGNCSSCSTVGISDAANALRRIRSSGVIKRQFNNSTNNASYYTDSKQYLTSRNKMFTQNQYNFLRQGDSSQVPGTTQSISNIYVPNGTTTCPKYFLTHDVSYQYKWLDASNYEVDICGNNYYSVVDLDNILKQTMLSNGHYYITAGSQSKVYLLDMAYNNSFGKVELNALTATSYVSPNYSAGTSVPDWSQFVGDASTPYFIFNNSSFASIIGFNANSHFPSTQNNSTNQYILSPNAPLIGPSFTQVYYKPNNPQFAQQGAVTSSSLTARLKYMSVTNSTAAYRRALGAQVGDALAYGVPEYGYTVKDKIGYPNKVTPVVTSTGVKEQCSLNRANIHTSMLNN
jgi:hypothetical protein